MLCFVTENRDKIANATTILSGYNIQISARHAHLDELQSDSLEYIIRHKAQQAFQIVRQPLVVKDDGWYITALNGFPGPYMRYINQWLTEQDFLNLLKPHTNKEVVFREFVCYLDQKQQKIFSHEARAQFLTTPRGNGVPSTRLVTFRKDGKTMAECSNAGIHFMEAAESVWHQFAPWYTKQKL